MPRLLRFSRDVTIALAAPCSLMLLLSGSIACSDASESTLGSGGTQVGGSAGVGGSGAVGGGGEGGASNPPNPDGLGPKRVDLGEANDLAAAGAYVLLGKTGLTNVTGSQITGGHLGLS
ncbi:MAG: hypothetical protein KC731_26720, partial [Myxococcales bacterium]|nr:hypothetical protein [Myxococcales bacterium]